jgi:AcrR family transcriptional regulator
MLYAVTRLERKMDNVEGLPASVAAAWGRAAPPRKGPARGLSVERIVAAAVQVADAEGVAAVSMARVASELGAATMSLYRYVAAKDELVELMLDRAYGQPPELGEPAGDGDWRAGLTRWAHAIRSAYRRHPWTLQIPISMPPITPNQVAWMERGLWALRDADLPAEQKLSVVLLLSGFVRNDASLAVTTAAAAATNSWAREVLLNYPALLRALTDPGRHPALTEALAAGAFEDDDPGNLDGEFTFGLDRVLDGIEVLITGR